MQGGHYFFPTSSRKWNTIQEGNSVGGGTIFPLLVGGGNSVGDTIFPLLV